MRKSKAFTLVELVVVIAVIGILAGIAIPQFTEAIATSKGAKVQADLRNIQAAYYAYLTKNGIDAFKDLADEPSSGAATTRTNKKIIPKLVAEGYLEGTPVMPSGKIIFAGVDTGYDVFTLNNTGNMSYVMFKQSGIDAQDYAASVDTPYFTYPLEQLVSNK